MLDPSVALSRAASAAAAGAERLRTAVNAAQAGKEAVAQLAATASSFDLDSASSTLKAAVGSFPAGELLPANAVAQVSRAMGALSVAQLQVESGLAMAQKAGEIGKAVVSAVQSVAADFSGSLAAARQQVSALVSGGAATLKQGYASVVDALTGATSAIPIMSSLAAPLSMAPPPSSAQPHLLILSSEEGGRYYFGLSTAAYDSLKRDTSYNVAAQERLQREEALQAVTKGGESLTVTGTIYTSRSGARQLDELRQIGRTQKPIQLTTGYGDVLGRWYLTKIGEDQGGLMPDGAPRKQQFTLEFRRYGDDFANG